MKSTSDMSKKEALKRLFRNYRHMDAHLKRQLNSLGIEVIKRKKHWLLRANGQCFCCPCTSSDYRAGLNLATMMAKAI